MRTPVLETERLILRPITTADAQDAFDRWTSDDRVSKYMRYSTHKSVEETKTTWLSEAEKNIDSDTAYDWGIVDKEKNYLFGSIGLFFKEDKDMFELGYNIMFDYWNKGYTTEAARAVLDFARDVLMQKKIYCCHAVENIASGKVMIKNGFVPTGYGTNTNFDGSVKQIREYILEF